MAEKEARIRREGDAKLASWSVEFMNLPFEYFIEGGKLSHVPSHSRIVNIDEARRFSSGLKVDAKREGTMRKTLLYRAVEPRL